MCTDQYCHYDWLNYTKMNAVLQVNATLTSHTLRSPSHRRCSRRGSEVNQNKLWHTMQADLKERETGQGSSERSSVTSSTILLHNSVVFCFHSLGDSGSTHPGHIDPGQKQWCHTPAQPWNFGLHYSRKPETWRTCMTEFLSVITTLVERNVAQTGSVVAWEVNTMVTTELEITAESKETVHHYCCWLNISE